MSAKFECRDCGGTMYFPEGKEHGVHTCPECGGHNVRAVSDGSSAPRYTGMPRRRPSLFERNEAAVYATGNRWAIENWNATHY